MILKPIGNLTKHSWPVCLKAYHNETTNYPSNQLRLYRTCAIDRAIYPYDPDDTSPPNHPFLEYTATLTGTTTTRWLWQYLAQGQSQWTPYWFTDTGFGRNWNRPEYRLCEDSLQVPYLLYTLPTNLTTCDAAMREVCSTLSSECLPNFR